MRRLLILPVLVLAVTVVERPISRPPTTGERVRLILAREAPKMTETMRNQVAETILRVSEEHRLPPLLILAVMKVESRFRPEARSNRNAHGLMQVKPIVLKDLGYNIDTSSPNVRELLQDPLFNIQVGTAYLAKLVRRFDGNQWKAVMAYNHGPTAVAKRFSRKPVPSKGYQARVFRAYVDFIRQS